MPWVHRIYDNGPIQVYDLSVFLGKSHLVAPPGLTNTVAGRGFNVGVVLVALLVGVLWVIRLRRRSRPVHVNAHRVLCGLAGAMVVAVFGAFLVRLTRLSPNAVALGALLVLALLSLRPAKWGLSGLPIVRKWSTYLQVTSSAPVDAFSDPGLASATGPATPPLKTTTLEPLSENHLPKETRRSRLQRALGGVGMALIALAIILSTVTAIKEWTPPPELSVTVGPSGQSVADVQLGSAGPIPAKLEIFDGAGKALWIAPLSRDAGAQSVALPASLLRSGSRVSLVSNGHVLREVSA